MHVCALSNVSLFEKASIGRANNTQELAWQFVPFSFYFIYICRALSRIGTHSGPPSRLRRAHQVGDGQREDVGLHHPPGPAHGAGLAGRAPSSPPLQRLHSKGWGSGICYLGIPPGCGFGHEAPENFGNAFRWRDFGGSPPLRGPAPGWESGGIPRGFNKEPGGGSSSSPQSLWRKTQKTGDDMKQK